ncbi:MAG: rod shape-determining protein RodA [Gammaproteobacteria bacterium]
MIETPREFDGAGALNVAGRLFRSLHIDGPLLCGLLVLCAMGLMVLYSADGGNIGRVENQLVRIGVALCAMLVLCQVPPNFLRVWSPWLYGAGLVLLLFVAIGGVQGKGAQRWLDLGVIRFQPSEIMKLAMPMLVAWYLHSRTLPPKFRELCALAVIVIAPAVMIARQPDLGTALLVASSGLFVVFLAGISLRWILGLGSLALAGAPVLWYFMQPYQKSRVLTLLDPERDPLGAGYHTIQAKIAIGSGGLFGKGWLNSTQARLEFLPESSTDFIFAVIGEEFGLIGLVVVLGLYLFILGRCAYIATQAQDTFSRLLAGGLGLTFFVYVFVNTGMVTGLLPVVGVPLPLISYGGTSMVTLMAGFGILMSIHTHRKLLTQ